MSELIDVPPGLSDVAVAETEVGDVVGDRGYYHYRGRSAPELARAGDFEAAASLLLSDAALGAAGDRSLPDGVAAMVDQVDLRSGFSLLTAALAPEPLDRLSSGEAMERAGRVVGAYPTLVASIRHGRPIDPDPDLGHVADYLRMMRGAAASDQQVSALQAYAVLTLDHGLANSTFAGRVVASTGTDLGSCLLAAFGSLTAPRHGADGERILEMYDAIGEPSRAEAWLQAEVAAGRRLQGFGHSVYRAVDPRLEILREHSVTITPDRHATAWAVEEAGLRVLAGRRKLVPNLDLYAPVVLEGCGIERGWFAATFAMARIVGWCAHAVEQAADKRILRPAARYVGPPPDLDVY